MRAAFRPHRMLRLAGPFLALVLVVASCGDAEDDPVSANQTSNGDAVDGAATDVDAQDADAGTEPTANDTTDDADGSEGAELPETTPEGGDTTEVPAAPAEPWDSVALALEPVASMSEPTSLATRPGNDHLWVTERVGRVRLVERAVDTAANTEVLTQVSDVVLDISDQVDTGGEGGLLGMDFSADGQKLYLHYTDRDFYNVISEFAMGETTADAASERILLRIEQPFSNHNGGDLHFGPDGMLYIGVGDGGSADDPLGSGQNADTLLGTLLRIDPAPSDEAAYTVPSDNPFVGGGGAPEIWSWGLRNPWRFSFDAETGDLWIGDVGQNQFEEIDFLPATGGTGAGRGANLGWNLVEGNENFAGEPPTDHVGPIHTYDRDSGCSVTGGWVYRGAYTPSLTGIYIYADYCTGEVWGLERQADGSAINASLQTNTSAGNVVSFGQGPDGEIYVLDLNGAVSRLQAADLALTTTLSSR